MLILRAKDKQLLFDVIRKSFSMPVEIWAYGSRVDGSAHEASDLDLIVRNEGLLPLDWEIMENFRENLQNSNIPFLVEARDWTKVPEYFHDQILKNHVVFYPDEHQVVRHKE